MSAKPKPPQKTAQNSRVVRSKTEGPRVVHGGKFAGTELAETMKTIREKKGDGVIRRASRLPKSCHIETGAFVFDFATLGGIPESVATLVAGLESSGKTTVVKKTTGNWQRKHTEEVVFWLDAESMFDPAWASRLGMNIDEVVLGQPETGQEGVDLIDAMMKTREVGLIVLDSIPSLVPKAVLAKSAEDDTMTELARLLGKLCSKILSNWVVERKRGHHITLIFINQPRTKVGFMQKGMSLPGGRQINHLPTTRAMIKNEEIMGRDSYGHETPYENNHSFKLTKAKHGASMRSGAFTMIMANRGHATGLAQGSYDNAPTIATFAKEMGVITGGGSSWRFNGLRKDAGKFKKLADMTNYLYENPLVEREVARMLMAIQRTDKQVTPVPPDGWLWGRTKNGVAIPPSASALFAEGTEIVKIEAPDEEEDS